MLITPTSLTVNQLFGSNNEQYVIPTYQRRYSWHERQVWDLIEDIELIENSDTHLLGSIVCLTGHHKAGLNKLELVDGQQRLTTTTILLECIRQRLIRDGEASEAAEVGRMLTAKPLGGQPVPKVSLDSIDAEEFSALVKNEAGREYQNQHLVSTFRIVREWVGAKTLEKLGSFLYRLQNQAIVIRLDVSEAKDAFKLFETINNRGLRLSPTDIIKNFLLGNAARFGDEALELARQSWSAVIRHLDGMSSDAFFRYYLMAQVHSRLTVGDVVPQFKKVFMSQVEEAANLPERHLYPDQQESEEDEVDEGADGGSPTTDEITHEGLTKMSFRAFLKNLAQSSKIYGELLRGQTSDPVSNRHLRNLRMIKAVQTYGFLMHLRAGACPDKTFREVLKLTEAFVLRRHICRERANETEALFARLCAVNPVDPVTATRQAYRDLCPSDEKFRDEFSATTFPANLIDRARYCLEQIELAKHGNYAELQVLGAEDVHVEHIMPQKIKTKKSKEEFGDWAGYLGEKAETLHSKYVARIGNLTIFAGPLNIGASNNPFVKKQEAYRESSIMITRDLLEFSEFKFSQIDERSRALADVAVSLWPSP